MAYLSVVVILLALFPLIVAMVFRAPLVERKTRDILEGLQKLGAFDDVVVKRWAGEEGLRKDITERIGEYYSPNTLTLPALLLAVLYCLGFLMAMSCLNAVLNQGSGWPFSRNIVMAARPVMFVFLGVYLFNIGTTVRRLYLYDLTEHVFWNAVNRFLLTAGLAIVISTAYKVGADPDKTISQYYYFLFFAVGFLANAFLKWVLEIAMRIGNIFKPQTADLPLQMVQGINIWKEYRLEEEGIENVQNLANADVIDLAVKTHYNLRTLIDWMDQAILIDRLGEGAQKLREKALIAGAIDMAWLSPEYTGSTASAEKIAALLEVEPHFVISLMNSLYEDAHVGSLWTLWQTRREVRLAEA